MNNENANVSTDKPIARPVAPLLKTGADNASPATQSSAAETHKDGAPATAPAKGEPKKDANAPGSAADAPAAPKN